MLRLADRWVWDFWLVADGRDQHLFYLQADRALGDPDLRHWHASIGHAVSRDLRSWTVLADALAPAPGPAWDDFTTWTGSVVRADGQWHLFYTGTSHADEGLVQRVGHAMSGNLAEWERAGAGPAFELDDRWYERLDLSIWHDQAWRDPFLIRHDGEWNALVTARLSSGPADERGTIGLATSPDLSTWTVQPPLSGATPFGHLEIPAVRSIGDCWYLFFAGSRRGANPDRDAPGDAELTGTFAVPSTAGPLGPWDWARVHLVLGGGWYGAKVVDDPTGDRLVALAWREREPGGGFGGWISDPMPVAVVHGDVRVDA